MSDKAPQLTVFPASYYDAELTLDVEVPGAKRRVRFWFDARDGRWTPQTLAMLAKSMRRQPNLRTHAAEVIVDWAAASFEGLNAVQVTDYVDGYHVGAVAYLRPFDAEDNFVLKLRAWWRRVLKQMPDWSAKPPELP